jgi:hypothetical protein
LIVSYQKIRRVMWGIKLVRKIAKRRSRRIARVKKARVSG